LISMSSENPKTYKLRLSNRAAKYLSRLDKTTTSRILDKLEHLKVDPYHSVGTKKLSGKLTGLFRLRKRQIFSCISSNIEMPLLQCFCKAEAPRFL
jgi:Txe/YoeB family toxin of Txe-Axe toxin-antitoxin module